MACNKCNTCQTECEVNRQTPKDSNFFIFTEYNF